MLKLHEPVAAGRWMLLLATLLLLAQASPATVAYPLRWRWSNPLPHGGNIVDMAYSTTLGLAVQVAERGQIFTSNDLDLWLPRDSNTTNSLQGVTFFGSRIVIVGENGTALYADEVGQFKPGQLLDGPTSDWLIAVAGAADLLVAAGDNGAIFTSTNGATWKRQSGPTTTWFRGVAAGAGAFVVVGEDGVIVTSPNGTNWTQRASTTTNHLNRIHFGLGKFTAVGEGGVTIVSTNSGVTWFAESPGATNALHYATAGGVDRLLDGDNEVRLQDSSVWSNELAKTNGPPAWLYYSATGLPGFFTVVGQSGMIAEGYQVSTNPYFWLTPYESIRHWLWDVIRLPSFYCAAGDFGTILTSGNGVDWTLELVPQSVTNTTFLGIGGNTNLLLAAGDSGNMIISPNILTNIVLTNGTTITTQIVSTIGVLWYPAQNVPTTNVLQGIGVVSNSLYVVSGSKGTIITSPDGTNWALRTSGTTNTLSSIAEWPGGLIATGNNGTLVTSSDGITWARRVINTTNWIYRVRWLNGMLIAVGQNGLILTSSNGVDWVTRASGTTSWLNDAAFIEDTWFAIGVKGTVLTSTNLSQWTPRGTITKKALYATATDGGQMVLVGVEGVAIRSQIVPDVTPVNFLDYAHVTTSGPSPAYNIFLFGGKTDQQFTLDRTTNLVGSAWTTGASLEIYDGAGTLYYVETVTGTNLPQAEDYRTTLSPWPK